MPQKWFVIVNPTSGNGASKKLWPLIYQELLNEQFSLNFEITTHKNHAEELIQKAIKNGFTNFISVGGDGTLHAIVNGILNLNPTNLSAIKIGIIPIGTGNDWIKTYEISKNYRIAIQIIKEENTVYQDIGKIHFPSINKTVYFNNLAGIGFDGYVVNKVHKFKNLGSLAYLSGALVSLISFKKPTLQITFNNQTITSKTLLLLMGICNFCGGGMQLTKNPVATDGLFDISFVKNISFFQLVKNISNLFNGSITNKSFVKNYKTSQIEVNIEGATETFIQADGETIETSNFIAEILPKKLQFIVYKN